MLHVCFVTFFDDKVVVAFEVLLSFWISFTEGPAPEHGDNLTNTSQSQIGSCNKEMAKFCRKLRLKDYFGGKDIQNDNSLVKPNSDFSPGRNRDRSLDTYIDFLLKYPLENKCKEMK